MQTENDWNDEWEPADDNTNNGCGGSLRMHLAVPGNSNPMQFVLERCKVQRQFESTSSHLA